MKRYFHALLVMLGSVLMYTSCLGSNDDDATYYNDTSISAFSLTTVNRYIHTTSKSGTDSVYKTTLSSLPLFTIDHYRHKIYNTDSLPMDCDLSHILASVTSYHSGIVTLKSLTSDSLSIFNSSDSIDFSKPREFRIYAQDNSDFRSYEVTVNMHQAETGKILWEKMSPESYPADTEKQKWEQLVADAGLKAFIGAGTKEAYAFSQDHRLMVTKDGGVTWTPDSLDDDAAFLPRLSYAFVSYPFAPNEDTDYQILAGVSEEGEVASFVWRKIAEYGERSLSSKWVYMPAESYNRYYLPAMTGFSLVRFHGYVLAVSSSDIYASRDGGITWRTSDMFSLPGGSDAYYYNVEAVTDDEGALWFKDKDTNDVWRGVFLEK